MNFKEKLDSLVKVMVEFSDPTGVNVEWYESIDYWENFMWSMVRNHNYTEGESVNIKENVETLKASVIDLSDEDSLKRFRSAGSIPSYMNRGLWKLKQFMDSEDYTHVFIYGIGELDNSQIEEFKIWLNERISDSHI